MTLRDAQDHCCAPPQWQGLARGAASIALPGEPPYLHTFGCPSLAVDLKERMMIALRVYIFRPEFVIDIWVDYNKGVIYTVWQESRCERSTVMGPPPRCIPEDWEWEGFSGLGVYGSNNTMEVSGYSHNSGATSYGIVVTADSCLPVQSAVLTSGSPKQVLEFVDYYNLWLGIADPRVFDIPSICESAVETERPNPIFGSLIGWFSSPTPPAGGDRVSDQV